MTEAETRTINTPGKVPARRRRSGMFNLLLIVGIIAAVALFTWAEMERRATADSLEQTKKELEEVRKSTRAGGEEVAKQVLEKVRKHIDVATEPVPTVATITDIARLREANDFYQSADNGDHLIITSKRAILYDPERDIVLDVVPVVLDASATPVATVSPVPSTASGAPATSVAPPAGI